MKYNVTVRPGDEPRTWITTESFCYGKYCVPEGFKFNGASIPVGLRWLFPHGGAKFPASCIHDYLYETGESTREEADMIFLKIMLANEVPKWRAYSMYYAVRTFGRSHYNGE